jgi:iron complex outermembrane receptor protein
MRRSRFGAVLAVAAWLAAAAAPAGSTEDDSDVRESVAVGVVRGAVSDSMDGTGIPQAAIRLDAGQQAMVSGERGAFLFKRVSAGEHTVSATRVGYRPISLRVVVRAGDTTHVAIPLARQALVLPPVAVVVEPGAGRDTTGAHPVLLSGRRLDERLGGTVSSTLAREPGVGERTMGPAPARPVLRGLTGSRLLLLEDGAATGDLSATSPDHAVAIDPLGVERIEIVRGPEALLYGSSVLAGVVNVERVSAPDPSRPRPALDARVQGGSGNGTRAGRFRWEGGTGRFSAAVDGAGRLTGDERTPHGTLPNTSQDGWNALGAAWWNSASGTLGLIGSSNRLDYGVPGGFLGGHPNGVDIEMERRFMEARFQRPGGIGAEPRFDARAGTAWFSQRELESSGDCGVSFGVLRHYASARVRHGESAIFRKGTLGFSGEYRDFASGCFTFLPPTIERSASVALLEEVAWSPLLVRAAARFDVRNVSPSRREVNKAGVIRSRSFRGMSGAVSALIPVGRGARVGTTVIRSFRPPALEELFAEGPHLAAYSYEVGNADLDSEHAMGVDLFAEGSLRTLQVRASYFRHDVRGYIEAVDTGELEYGPGADGFLARFRYQGRDVVLQGGELETHWQPRHYIELEATASAVRGRVSATARPLPRMPAPTGRLAARLRRGTFEFGAALRASVRQGRLGDFEEPTEGYCVMDFMTGWSAGSAGCSRTLVLRLENLFDTEYRNHLSRIKSIAPERGRSVTVIGRFLLF